MSTLMSLEARKEMLAVVQAKYQSADWKNKHQILDGFIAATGYERKHAIKLLNNKVSPKNISNGRRGKPAYYTPEVIQVLEMLWHASNQICSKRLVPFLPELIAALERHKHLYITDDIKSRLLNISPASLDRLLHKEKTQCVQGGVSATTPGTLLKNKITVRTFSDWNEEVPGFFEADLVAHCGESVTGVYLNTFVMTDIVTTWTECIALIRKSADDVILGLKAASQLLPFSLLGFDVDNGSEFINNDVMAYCKENSITFTRSRPYKKNDQAHVEERNGSIVRRLIGYDRYEGEAAWEAMCHLYAVLRLYINFFQPSLKLINKIRKGSKTIKKYDTAKTPYQRVLLSSHVSQEKKDELTTQYHQLDPILLQEELKRLQTKLWQYAWKDDIMPVVDELTLENVDNASSSEKKTIFYRKTKKSLAARNYRTRQDPFERVRQFIDFEMQVNPNLHAKELLDKLISHYPGSFCYGHLRTLQRRVCEIRSQQENREKKYQDLMVSKKHMTTELLTVSS